MVCASSLVLIAGVVFAAPAAPQKIKLHGTITLHVAPQADAKDDGHCLEDASRELRDAIDHKAGLHTVDSADGADFRVEVTGCEQRDAGSGGYGGLQITKFADSIIRFHVSGVDADEDLKGTAPGGWNRAAKDGAERLLKWVARHEPKR